jgi:hypothetical protein
MEHIATTDMKWGRYDTVCTNFFIPGHFISFNMREKIIGRGKPKASEYVNSRNVLRKFRQKNMLCVYSSTCLRPTQGELAMLSAKDTPNFMVKSLKPIIRPYMGA